MGQSRMDNQEKLGILGKQDKGRRQTKQKPQHRKLKQRTTRTPPNTKGEPRRFRRAISSGLL